MLNVNELTARMAKMSDAQLRQYAQLHKNDPYTLALAASESKRRAQLRAAAQQQMDQGQQPTVADQALAEMGAPMPRPQLPEQQGIGMLPAENVATMADGGIAGYDDQFVNSYADAYAGGGIVAFAGEGPSLVGPGSMTPEEQLRQVREREKQEDAARALQTKGREGFATGFEALDANARQGMATTIRQKLQNNIPLNSTEENLVKSVPEFKQLVAAEMAKRPQPTTVTAPTAKQEVKPQAKPSSGADKKVTTKPPSVGKEQPPAAAPAPAGFVPTEKGDLTAELKRLQSMQPGTTAYDELGTKIEQGFAALQKEREESKPTGKALEGLEALLGKEEEKAKGREARNFNMALINAGLAIAGGRSQYALQNIAEGAQVGTKQYQEGLDKLEAAAIERRKQAALIEEARRAEARGDWKENAALKQAAFEAGLAVDRSKIEGVQKMFDTSMKGAIDIVNTQNQLSSADRRAVMQEQGLNVRAREQNAAELQRARIMAAAYSGRGSGGNPVNLAADNAAALLKIWQNTIDGKMATPEQLQEAYDRFYAQEAKKMGLPVPGPAAVAGGAKFLGFE